MLSNHIEYNANLFICLIVKILVLILNGNSEIGAHVKSNLCHLNCLMHLNRSKAVTTRIFSLCQKLHVCATCSKLPSNISTMARLDHYHLIIGTRRIRIKLISLTLPNSQNDKIKRTCAKDKK